MLLGAPSSARAPMKRVQRDVGVVVGFAAAILTGVTAGVVWEAKHPARRSAAAPRNYHGL